MAGEPQPWREEPCAVRDTRIERKNRIGTGSGFSFLCETSVSSVPLVNKR